MAAIEGALCVHCGARIRRARGRWQHVDGGTSGSEWCPPAPEDLTGGDPLLVLFRKHSNRDGMVSRGLAATPPAPLDRRSLRLYVASSWRNEVYPSVVAALVEAGHDVYDFRSAPTAFAWKHIDPEWEAWDVAGFLGALSHPLAQSGYRSDAEAMRQADAGVLVLPSGRSAHIEAGWMVGRGKPLCIYAPNWEPESHPPELMYLLAHDVAGSRFPWFCTTLDQVLGFLAGPSTGKGRR